MENIDTPLTRGTSATFLLTIARQIRLMPPIWCVSMVRCCGTWVRQRWVEKKGKHFRRWLFWFKVMFRKMVLEMICISTSISYRIHGTFGIFTYHQHHKKSSSHVGNHSSHTHAMGNRYFAGSGHTSESESIGGKEIVVFKKHITTCAEALMTLCQVGGGEKHQCRARGSEAKSRQTPGAATSLINIINADLGYEVQRRFRFFFLQFISLILKILTVASYVLRLPTFFM